MKFGFKTAAALGAMAAFAVAAPASATPTLYFNHAEVDTNSYTTVTKNGTVLPAALNNNPGTSDAFVITDTPLNATSTLTTVAKTGSTVQSTAHNDETATATFASPGSGSVTFVGNSSASVSVANVKNSALAYGSDQFSYDFTTLGHATVLYSFATSTSNSLYFEIYDTNTLATLTSSTLTVNGSTGTFSFFIPTAGDYSIFFADGSINNDFVSKSATVGSNSATSISRSLNFSITAVPEPATWAFMLVGFGLIGVSLRQRKAALAAA